MTVAGNPPHPQDPQDPWEPFDVFKPHPRDRATPPDPSPTQREELLGTLCYAGVIFFGPVVPLIVRLTTRDTSPFVRQHATQALNVALTWLLYAVSGSIIGALLALDNGKAALIIMLPVAAAGWLIMVVHLVRGAVAASRGGFRQIPAWICSPLVPGGSGGSSPGS